MMNEKPVKRLAPILIAIAVSEISVGGLWGKYGASQRDLNDEVQSLIKTIPEAQANLSGYAKQADDDENRLGLLVRYGMQKKIISYDVAGEILDAKRKTDRKNIAEGEEVIRGLEAKLAKDQQILRRPFVGRLLYSSLGF